LILDAIDGLSKNMDKMLLKSDFDEFKNQIAQQTSAIVSEAIDPLKAEVLDLKNRMQSLESQPPASTAVNKQILELQKLVDQYDPAIKRIAFTGWPDSMAPEARINQVNAFVAQHCPGTRINDTGNFYTGPYNDRKIAKAAYVEFISPDAAKAALTKIKDIPFKVDGNCDIHMKPARSKLNGKRNFSLRRAEELIQAHASAAGKEIKLNFKTEVPGVRNVTVNDEVAFIQTKGETGGRFLSPFENLALP
jgi:hypothetical protein